MDARLADAAIDLRRFYFLVEVIQRAELSTLHDPSGRMVCLISPRTIPESHCFVLAPSPEIILRW